MTRLQTLRCFMALLCVVQVNCLNRTIDSYDLLEADHHERQTSWDDMLEGDIRVDEDSYRYDNVTRRLASTHQLWDQYLVNDYFRMYVYIDQAYTDDEKQIIEKSLQLIQYSGKAIKFQIRWSKPGKDFLYIKKAGGCWSYLGRTYRAAANLGGQTLSLEPFCCNTKSIHHLMMHALGFGHEHSRLDRDQHIKINKWNIISGNEKEFQKHRGLDTYGVPYDHRSVTHYSENAFSKNGGKTIESIKSGKRVESKNRCSWRDFERIRVVYQCVSPYRLAKPRTFSEYRENRCTIECKCWKNSGGCGSNDNLCKNNLRCIKGSCK